MLKKWYSHPGWNRGWGETAIFDLPTSTVNKSKIYRPILKKTCQKWTDQIKLRRMSIIAQSISY